MAWIPLSVASFRAFSGFRKKLRHGLRAMGFDFLDSYQPERHYMRGPGPKWRERHHG